MPTAWTLLRSLRNIHPLSDFQRNTQKHLARLKKSGEPEVLTINGKAEMVVLSADAFHELIKSLELAENLQTAGSAALEALRAGVVSPEELKKSLKPASGSRLMPADDAFAEIRRKIAEQKKKKAS